MFLLAYCNLGSNPRRIPVNSLGKSLRRVGADIAVLINCDIGTEMRIKRTGRYTYAVTRVTGTKVAVVLSRQPLTVGETQMHELFSCKTKMGDTAITIGVTVEPPKNLYKLLLKMTVEQPIILAGQLSKDLSSEPSTSSVEASGFTWEGDINGHAAQPQPEGVLVKGLRVYGGDIYHSDGGTSIQWVRIEH